MPPKNKKTLTAVIGFNRVGLTGRTAAVLLIVISIGCVFAVRLSLETLNASYEGFWEQSMERMARQMCASVMEPVIIGDYASVQGILTTMVTGQGVAEVAFEDMRGHIVFAQAHQVTPEYPRWFERVVTLRAKREAVSPLVVGGRAYGSCKVASAQVEFKNIAWKEFTRIGLIWGTTGAGLVLALVYVIQSGLRPLKRAILAIKRDEAVTSAIESRAPPEIRQAVMLLNELRGSYGSGAIGRAVEAVHNQLIQFQKAINDAALVVETDRNGVIQFVNGGLRSLADGPQVFETKLFWHVFGGSDVNDFTKNAPWKKEISTIGGGIEHILAVWGFPITGQNDVVEKWLVIGNEVTEFKKLQQELREAIRERSAMLAQLTHATEDERRRIARELHDEMGQRLVSLMMDADVVGHFLGHENIEGRKAVLRLRENAQSTYRQVNDMIDQMRPPLLESLTLVQAIDTLISQWAARMREVNFATDIDATISSSNAVEVAVFRIVQEALTNIAKHAAQAHRVDIEIKRRNGDIYVRVEDDGAGGEYKNANGMGIKAMRERAIALGGTFQIGRGSPSGTRIIVTLPT